MANDSCPLPSTPGDSDTLMIARMLQSRRIAIIGASDDPMRPSHNIGQYLKSQGFEIVPVNPKYAEVLGEPCYRSLQAVPGPIDLVNVFRRPLACGQVTREAIAIGARGVWLQSGIFNDEARALAREAGVDFVQNRCIMIEHMHQR
jgi:uncharacterized protein